MNITTKSKYALRAMIHLARTKNGSARREDLAAAQGGISREYLEKILLRLRQKNLVDAKTGPGGGYRLARPPADRRGSPLSCPVIGQASAHPRSATA